MEIPEEMIETLVPAVREQLESPDTAYVKNCLERLTGREKLGEQEALELMAQALPLLLMRWWWGAAPLIRESTRRC